MIANNGGINNVLSNLNIFLIWELSDPSNHFLLRRKTLKQLLTIDQIYSLLALINYILY